MIEREFFASEFGEAFDALLQTMERDAGVEEFHQLADGGDLTVIEVGEAIDLSNGSDEADPMPASDHADGDVEHLTEHGGGVLPVHPVEVFLKAEEVEPIGFGEDAERFPLFLKFFGEGEFDGGVAIRFEGPAFLTDDEDGGLSADMPHRSSAVAFDEL